MTSVAYGWFVVRLTVSGSITVAPVTNNLKFVKWTNSSLPRIRSTAVFTSLAVKSEPSCIFTPLRSLNVHVSSSALSS